MERSEHPWALLEERFSVLGRAGRELTGSQGIEDANLMRMARHALPSLGTWCALDLVDEDKSFRRVGIMHSEMEPEDLPDALVEDWQPRPDDPFGVGRASRTGQSEIISYVSDGIISRTAGSPRVEAELRELGMGSLLTVPLLAGDEVLGAMTFVSSSPDHYHQQDLLFAEELARLAALALDNARLRHAAGESRLAVEDILAENIRLNRRLVEVNEQLLLSAVREHEEAATAKDLQRETEALFSMIFDRAAMGIAVLDLEGRVADSNPALQEMFGYSHEELLGRHLTDFSSGREGEREWELFQELVAGKRDSFQIQKPARHRDGSTLWTNCVTSLGRSEEGPLYVINLTEDITDRKRMEEELRHSQRMEAVGRLAGGIAHDFNNILMAMGGRAEIAMEDLSRDDPLLGDLDEIGKGVERASRLTRQLLAFSRKQIIQPRILNLEDLLAEMKSMLMPLIGPVELSTSVEPDLGPVHADPSQMEQIIMNLVVNARDAMVDRKVQKLSITLRNEAVRENRATSLGGAMPPGSYVVLSVSDTGPGIPEEVLPLILEPFFTTKEVGKGTGLGLSMVYGIVRQSKGYIDARSELGKGTTFEIYLPEAGKESAATGESASAPPQPKSREEEEEDRAPSALVVDDEDAVRALLTRILERTGFRVITARTSGEALELAGIDLQPFDLAVLDVMMPDLPGAELARELRGRMPEIRTLFISGHEEEAVLEPEDFSEGSDFLTKPFSDVALLEKVRNLLPHRQPD